MGGSWRRSLRRPRCSRWWIQATCGLRQGECLSLERRDVGKLDGLTCLTVREEVSKTHKSKTVPMTTRGPQGPSEGVWKAKWTGEPTSLVFGHSEEKNLNSYTDATHTRALIDMLDGTHSHVRLPASRAGLVHGSSGFLPHILQSVVLYLSPRALAG